MLWRDVNNQGDIDLLMKEFGGFHDSCIKEMRFIGNAYVDGDFSMSMRESAQLRVVFQRQWDEPAVIELEFRKLKRMCVDMPDDCFSSDIFDAALFFRNGLIYWADRDNWTPEDLGDGSGCVWISSEVLRWRILEGRLGAEPIYRSPFGAHDDAGGEAYATKGGGEPL